MGFFFTRHPSWRVQKARPGAETPGPSMMRLSAFFSFLYLKKIKISKIYVRFEIFQNYPRSPYGGRQALSVIFFLQICNEVHDKKNQEGLSPPQRATGPCRPPEGRLPLSTLYTFLSEQQKFRSRNKSLLIGWLVTLFLLVACVSFFPVTTYRHIGIQKTWRAPFGCAS